MPPAAASTNDESSSDDARGTLVGLDVLIIGVDLQLREGGGSRSVNRVSGTHRMRTACTRHEHRGKGCLCSSMHTVNRQPLPRRMIR